MAHLFQVGAGSGGIVVLDLLARDPRIDRATLVEPDVYKRHNVYRHLFPASDIGRPKADAAADWLRDRRPDLRIETLAADVTAAEVQPRLAELVATCDVGVCAADNEPAKYHFDGLFRRAGKPWTLGEVLSGGIAGWVHRFTPGGPCYGCVASHLQREAPADPLAPAPDYSHPAGTVAETTVPASRASIGAVAGLHAAVTLGLLADPPAAVAFTSLLLPLARVPGVFDDPFRTYRFAVAKNPGCLVCSAVPPPAAGEELDAALDSALARLGHD
jgi:molybdopterin/thiamine biosynthesis adenylyltransferase